MLFEEVTAQNLPYLLMRSSAVLVDFYTPTCGPCRQMPPILDRISQMVHSPMKIVKVNIEYEPMVAQRFGVSMVPALGLFVQGQHKETLTGVPASPRQVVSILNEHGIY